MTATTATHTITATAITVPYKKICSPTDGGGSLVPSSVMVGVVSLVRGVVTGMARMELQPPCENWRLQIKLINSSFISGNNRMSWA